MIFDPPWVTVLPDSKALATFLADSSERAAAGAVELRLDCWESPPRPGEIASIPLPCLVTWRRGSARESDRLKYLRQLLAGEGGDLWLDLDVEAASAPEEHDDGFEHEVTVRGEVLLGPEAWEIDAVGVRRRRWDGRWPTLSPLTPGFDPQTRIAVHWPGQPSPEIRGWIMSNRPGWVELP